MIGGTFASGKSVARHKHSVVNERGAVVCLAAVAREERYATRCHSKGTPHNIFVQFIVGHLDSAQESNIRHTDIFKINIIHTGTNICLACGQMENKSFTSHKAIATHHNGVVNKRCAVIHLGLAASGKGKNSRSYLHVVTTVHRVVACVGGAYHNINTVATVVAVIIHMSHGRGGFAPAVTVGAILNLDIGG